MKAGDLTIRGYDKQLDTIMEEYQTAETKLAELCGREMIEATKAYKRSCSVAHSLYDSQLYDLNISLSYTKEILDDAIRQAKIVREASEDAAFNRYAAEIDKALATRREKINLIHDNYDPML